MDGLVNVTELMEGAIHGVLFLDMICHRCRHRERKSVSILERADEPELRRCPPFDPLIHHVRQMLMGAGEIKTGDGREAG